VNLSASRRSGLEGASDLSAPVVGHEVKERNDSGGDEQRERAAGRERCEVLHQWL
jgi:hypothetical protein